MYQLYRSLRFFWSDMHETLQFLRTAGAAAPMITAVMLLMALIWPTRLAIATPSAMLSSAHVQEAFRSQSELWKME
jgi:hypothetical protein